MLKRMVSPLVLALALAGGTAWAAGDAEKSSSAASDQQTAAGSASMTDQNSLTSDQLLDMDVKGANGEDIGQVEELVIDRQSGRVQGVVVSVGGFLGIGDKKVALPWNQLQQGQDDKTLTTSATKQQLEQAAAWQDPDAQTAAGGGTMDRPATGGTTTSPPPASTTR